MYWRLWLVKMQVCLRREGLNCIYCWKDFLIPNGQRRKCFLRFSHQSIERPLQLWSKWVSCISNLQKNLAASFAWYFFVMHQIHTSEGGMKTHTNIPESHQGQAMCGSIWIPWKALSGQHIELGRWSLSCRSGPRMLKVPGLWDFCQESLRQSRAALSIDICCRQQTGVVGIPR